MEQDVDKVGGQPILTDQARKKIEDAIERWGQAELEDVHPTNWAEEVEPLISAVRASERLSEDDFAIRINTHD